MIKKGPKGTEAPRILFFLHIISMHPTTTPVKKAMYKPTTIFGKPKISPIKNANLTSPNPIPRPLVTIWFHLSGGETITVEKISGCGYYKYLPHTHCCCCQQQCQKDIQTVHC